MADSLQVAQAVPEALEEAFPIIPPIRPLVCNFFQIQHRAFEIFNVSSYFIRSCFLLLIESDSGTGCESGCSKTDRSALTAIWRTSSGPCAVRGLRVAHGPKAWLTASADSQPIVAQAVASKYNTAAESCCYCSSNQA